MRNSTFVIDTNVFLSAFIFKSETPAKALIKCLQSGRVAVSEDVRNEYESKFLNAKFDPFLDINLRREFLASFLSICSIVLPEEKILI